MGNIIILDRKKKRASLDNQWEDPLGVDHAKREKARTIDIPNDSMNPIHRFLRTHSPKEAVGRKVYCVTDKVDILSGKIQDIIPPDFIVIRNKGVARMKDVVSMEVNDA